MTKKPVFKTSRFRGPSFFLRRDMSYDILESRDLPEEYYTGFEIVSDDEYHFTTEDGAIYLDYKSPPKFYWHSIDDDFDVSIHDIDGNRLHTSMYYDEEWGYYYLRGEYYPIYAWPGYPYMGVTSQGAFMPVVDKPFEAPFFRVAPNGGAAGYSLSVPFNDGNDTRPQAWGVTCVEDEKKDHYACYFSVYGDLDNIIIAGFNGISDIKWGVTKQQLLRHFKWSEIWSQPAAMCMSPDNSVVLTLFSRGFIVAVDTKTGEIVWSLGREWDFYAWEGNTHLVWSKNNLVVVRQTNEGTGSSFYYQTHIDRFDFSNENFYSPPKQVWSRIWEQELRTNIVAIALTQDNNILAHGTRTQSSGYTNSITKLISLETGYPIWERGYTVSEQPSKVDGSYASCFVLGKYGIISLNNHLRRINLETGDLDEEDTVFPVVSSSSDFGFGVFVRDEALPGTTVPPYMPEGRAAASYVVAEEKLWILGGNNKNGEMTSTVFVFDPYYNEWEIKTPLSNEMVGEGRGAYYDNWIYSYGYGSDFEPIFLRYNISTENSEILPLPTGTFYPEELVIIGNKIYTNLTYSSPQVFDIDTLSWSSGLGTSPFLAEITSYKAVALGEDIVIAGGTNSSETYRYTPETGAWEQLNDLPIETKNGVSLVINGEFYILGGHSMVDDETGTNRNFKLTQDPEDWVELSSFMAKYESYENRMFPSGGVIGETIYIAGGVDTYATGEVYDETFIYNPIELD